MTICYRTHALQRYTATFGISHNLCALHISLLYFIYIIIYIKLEYIYIRLPAYACLKVDFLM